VVLSRTLVEMLRGAVLRHLIDDRFLVFAALEASVERRVWQIVMDRRLINAHVSQPEIESQGSRKS
jgi:hypothetical protein